MEFDRTKLKFLPLSLRKSKSSLENLIIDPDLIEDFDDSEIFQKISSEIIEARKKEASVILTFGAHLIKNGLSLVLKKMIEKNYITHLATNGAGSIHDWEIAFHGKTEEDVQENLKEGKFGLWEETGKYLNLAIISGAYTEKGYGESVCQMIHEEVIKIPKKLPQKLSKILKNYCLNPGEEIRIKHPFKDYSIQNHAFKNNINFTVHPGFGYDIIYSHPLNHGVSIGKTAEIDFLKFVDSVTKLENGVYISIGSAIMSPMIFEKSLSMARNYRSSFSEKIENFTIVVNDIQESNWNWNCDKEPPKDNPAYYLRFCKTFKRCGAKNLYYIQKDNREFLKSLYKNLENMSNS